ncbi:hypothetical protein Slu03_27710 [Sediminihabitans luteus]|nr:hypothetical protein Slu03_27710 [Sediminihabitans luteus]
MLGRGQVARLVRAALAPEALVPDDAPPLTPSTVLVLVVPVAELPARRPGEVLADVRAALDAARAAGVERVVAITSAVVHGAAPGALPHDDDAPPTAADGVRGVLPEVLDVESELAVSGVAALTVLRPTVLVGPGVDTALTRHLTAPRLLVVRGAAHRWQMLHVDDLVEAVRVVVEQGLTGAVTVGAVDADGAPDLLTADETAAAAGLRTITVPAATAFSMAESLHRARMLPAGAQDLAFAVYPWTVTAARLVEAGWRSTTSSAAAVAQVRDAAAVPGRRKVDARDAAALGAAGAAVAVLATAAVWRRRAGGR